MKSISFASGTLVTSAAAAEALLGFVSTMSAENNSIVVEIPVLEQDGTIATHSVVLSSSIQFDVADSDEVYADENELPIPELPQPDTMVAIEPRADAAEQAKNFDRAIADIDSAFD
ncbi:hypothetical protein [Conyzicola sp.]|uniref:hypothetical protein n=1 Tax=Conyzicola sp. TaxID=1969404 RepID=UPI00398972AF